MKYSDYSIENLMQYQEYKKICNMFLALAKDNDTKEKMESILYLGGYKNYNPFGGLGKNNPIIDIERRIGLAYLILTNPESFNQIVDNNIVYFHGTNANVLPGILKYGINSVDKLKEQQIDVITGEEWSRINGGRDFISFTDLLDVAEEYSNFPSKKQNELSFPIVLGTTKENILKSFYRTIKSDVPEVGVKEHFSKELITCIMVPSSKIEIVRKIVDPEMLILPMDNIENKFYQVVERVPFELYISEERYQKIANNISINDEKILEVKEVVFSRSLKEIKNKIEKLLGLAKGDVIDGTRIIK